MTDRLAANASKLSAAAICMLSMRSAASTSTSDPRPIVTPLELISPSASLGPSAIGSRPARASACSPGRVSPSNCAQPRPIRTLPMSAISDRSPWPTDPIIRTTGWMPAIEQLDERFDELPPDADSGLEHPVDARDDHRADDVAASGRP